MHNFLVFNRKNSIYFNIELWKYALNPTPYSRPKIQSKYQKLVMKIDHSELGFEFITNKMLTFVFV